MLSFTTTSAPSVTTLAATAIAATSATLQGTANPNGTASTGWFRYSTVNPGTCNDTFGTRAPVSGGTSLGAGTSPLPFSEPLTGLTTATTYYYCAIGQNAVGTAFGAVMSFTTTGAPTVTTLAASAVATTSADLNGSADPHGSATTGWFRYSTVNPVTCNDTFGTRAPTTGGTSLGAGHGTVSYSQSLTGLLPGTTYFACAIAQNAEGLRFGTVVSFSTTAAPSIVSTNASSVTATAATLDASANPNNSATTGWFRYSTTDPGSCNDGFGTRAPLTGGASLGSGGTPVPFSEPITGLSNSTTYFYCAIAQNGVGTSFGPVLSFTTTAAPSVTSLAATAVASTSATLQGSANPNLAATTGWFRFSTTDPGACDDSFGTRAPLTGGTSLGAGSSPIAYNQALSGLTPATTYFFCAIAQNGLGTSFGSVLTFTTTAAPSVTTEPATAVTSTSASLEGSANPNLASATGWFRFATSDPGTCNDGFGTRAPLTGGTALGAGSSPVLYSQGLSGLTPATTYFYCAIAQNAVGLGFGPVLSFTTPAAPSVTTLAATGLSSTAATLEGSANPNLSATTGWFRFDTADPGVCDDSFGTRIPTSGGTSLGAGSSPVAYSEPLTGLTTGTTYYYCAIAQNGEGTSFGAVMSFTTSDAPTVTTDPPSALASTSATLEGTANPNLSAATGWFRYATVNPGSCNDSFGTRAPTSGGTSLGAGSSAVAFDEVVTGLLPGTTYFYCAIAQNAVATGFGTVLSFTTPAAPSVSTAPASPVASTSATLNGAVNPNLDATSAWFRYATSNPGSCNDTFGTATTAVTVGAGSTAVTIAEPLSGLAPATTYYFCAIAQNSVATAFGSVLSFTTTAEPSVTTAAATSVTSTSAVLEGDANPNLDAATGWFRYDTTDPGVCNDTFGTRAPVSGGTSLGAGSSPVAYSEALAGLNPGTTYYYCAIADNTAGTGFGTVLSFTTTDVPSVTSDPVTLVDTTSVTLNGSAIPNLDAATGWFRYDTTDPGTCNDSFGTRAPLSGGTSLGAGATSVAYAEALTGLTAGTTYYYCAIAQNGVGTGFGLVLSFTTADLPAVTTDLALATSNGATLQGSAIPNLLDTTGWFRYDVTDPGTCDDTFGTRVPVTGGTALGNGATAVPFMEVVTGLLPSTTYYYCAIAQSSAGISFGSVSTFTTSGAPSVVTDPATGITSSDASLEGTANPNFLASTGWFRYDSTDPGSCDDTFGTRVPTTGGTDLGAGGSDVAYSEAITGLSPGTTYYFCAIAENSDGVSFGAIESFTTDPAAPSVTTDPASNVMATTADLNGAADPNGASTTGWFRFDTTDPGSCDDTFGTRVPTTGGTDLGDVAGTAVAFSEGVTGLTPGATYYVCAIAENAEGVSFGEVEIFVAGADPPTVTTEEASAILATTATIAGTANPNATDAVGWFRYSDTDPGSCDDSFGIKVPETEIDLGGGVDAVPFTADLTDLLPFTTYYYCAAAQNLGGASFGEVRTFTTIGPPEVTTLEPALNGAELTLAGEGNPKGSETTAWFRYDVTEPEACDDSFGTRSPEADDAQLGSGEENVAFSQVIADLPAGTYYYCAIAENDGGMAFGEVVSVEVTSGSKPEPKPGDDADSGCGCRTTGAGDKGSASWLLALLALGLVRRRRAA
ncbi:MAG: MYXO-CTERM sorting domain-containing protein [Polyangiaceae bacterium]